MASQVERSTEAPVLAPLAPASESGPLSSVASRYGLPALVILVFLLIWQFLPIWLNVPTYELPNLSKTIQGLQDDWGTIGTALMITLQDALVGFVIGNALAVLGATIFAYSVNMERAFYPLAILVQTIPIIVYVPLLRIVFFKMPILSSVSDPAAVVGVTVLIVFFPTLVNMNVGFKSVDSRVLELMRLLNASRTQVFLKVRFPSAMPFLFSSLKITSTLAFVGAIVGEWMAASGLNVVGNVLASAGISNLFGFPTNPADGAGIGQQLNVFYFNVDKPGIFASVVVVSLLSMLFFGLMVLLERLAVPWQKSQ